MNSSIKKLLSILPLIVILLFFAYYIYDNIEEFKSIRLANPYYIGLLFLITFVMAIANGLIIKYLVHPFDIKLGFKEWFGLATITTFYNTIMPFRAGLITKAAYLKDRHNFPITNFLAMTAGLYVINFFVASLLGLISLAFLYFAYGLAHWLIFLVFLGLFLSVLGIIIISPTFSETKNNFINRFIRVMNGWNIIRKNKKMILLSSLVTFIQISLGAFATIISFNILGFNISFTKAIFLAALGNISILVSITPAGLGIQEAIQMFAGLVVELNPAKVLTSTVIRRAVTTIVTLILGPIFSYMLLKHKPDESKPKDLNTLK